MSRQTRLLKNEHIEDITTQRLREYEAKANVTVALPVPIDQVVEQALDLSILWDTIEEGPGETILGGLQSKSRMIVLNEKHLSLFNGKPGLLRSTIGHEAGHWDIDLDKAQSLSPSLFGDGDEPVVYRQASKSNERVEVLLKLATCDERAYRLYRQITSGQDTPEQKSAVDRYQSALLMPRWLMKGAAQRFDLTQWPELYRLMDEAQVTISNLVTRLRRLGLVYLPEGSETKKLYRSEDEYVGQGNLF